MCSGGIVSSAHIMSYLVTLHFGIILPLTYLNRSSILDLPIVFCKKGAFLAQEYFLKEYLIFLTIYCSDQSVPNVICHVRVV